MKKRIFLTLFLLLLCLTGCNDEQSLEANPTDLPFYRKENKYRYDTYKKKNPGMNQKNVVTRVNLGLDFPFYTHTKETPFLNQDFILVNKYYYLKKEYEPENLEKISPICASTTRLLVSSARKAFEKMCHDAMSDGLKIRAMSAYRSYEYQATLYENYVKKDGKEAADTYSARPGHSEHQTGLVVDIDNGQEAYTNFESTKEFEWMQKNAHFYGFILRYPKGKENITGYSYESWHYRYVGEKIAREINQSHLTLDEYYIQNIESKRES